MTVVVTLLVLIVSVFLPFLLGVVAAKAREVRDFVRRISGFRGEDFGFSSGFSWGGFRALVERISGLLGWLGRVAWLELENKICFRVANNNNKQFLLICRVWGLGPV